MESGRLHPLSHLSIDAALATSSAPAAAAGSPPLDNGSPFLGGEPPYVAGTRTPPERGFTNKRKLTLLALLDELAELRDEELEKEREIISGLTNDERTSSETEGIEKFKAFDEQMKALDLKLQSFANAVRQLGSSVGLLNAAYHLRARLTQVQYYFRENAAELFDAIPHAPNVGTKPYSARRRGKVRKPTVAPKPTRLWSTEIEELPDELDALAKDLHAFLNRLNDVPEFTDEAVNASIMAFEGDLKYRASCLREFKDQLRYNAVSRYINDLTEDLGAHMDSVKVALDVFIEVGVPTIRFSQKHTATGLQNLSTVATFFSGVTATTLQFRYFTESSGLAIPSTVFASSFDDHSGAVSDLVNALWISSLVFSIASAINSQLAYHWRAAMYRSPRSYVPWWVAIWITRTPLFFLVGSVIAFSAGLCAFTYSSKQSPAVSVIVTSFTSVTSSALLCVGLWFASERWAFARTKGSRWLLDILEDHSATIGRATGFTPAKKAAKRGAQRTQDAFRTVKRSMTDTSQRVVGVAGRMGDNILNVPRDLMSRTNLSLFGTDNGESQEDAYRSESPVTMFDNGSGSLGVSSPNAEKRKLSDRGKGNEGPIPEDKPLGVNTEVPYVGVSPPSAAESSNKESTSENSPGAASTSDSASPKNARFKAVAKRVVNTFKLTVTPHSQPLRSMSSPSVLSERHRRDSSEHQLVPSRIQTYVPMLRTLRFSQLLSEHVALVKHLQFSPDGQFLATCSWDKTALIWRVGSGPSDEFQVTHKLVHPARIGGFVGQVAWSPSGDLLLTKQLRSIKMWNPANGVCQKNIDRERNVQSVTWMPHGSGFVSVEWRMGSTLAEKRAHHLENIVGSDLVIIGTDGKEKRDHRLDRLQVWDAAVVPGNERIVAVATLIKSEQGLKPIKSRNEKRILIYNLVTEEIENQVPLLQEVRDITLTETGNYALVSYENKAPPQAWRIDKIAREQKCRLVLAHTYFTKHPVDFAGPSYFGGVNDTFVLAASKGGEIYIWERASGILLHSLKAPDQELTNIAWNHKSPSGFMFASAAHDGMVRIWTTTAAPPPSRSFAPSPEPVEAESPKQEFFNRPGSPPIASPGLMSPGSGYMPDR